MNFLHVIMNEFRIRQNQRNGRAENKEAPAKNIHQQQKQASDAKPPSAFGTLACLKLRRRPAQKDAQAASCRAIRHCTRLATVGCNKYERMKLIVAVKENDKRELKNGAREYMPQSWRLKIERKKFMAMPYYQSLMLPLLQSSADKKDHSIRASDDTSAMEFRSLGKRVFLSCVLVLTLCSASFSQGQWTRRNPLPTEASLFGIAWTGTQAVAVGQGGAIVTSHDGVAWTNQISGTKTDLNAITWADKQLVAVGSNGAILTSPDGNAWTSRASGTTAYLNGVAGHDGQIIVIGPHDTILASSDYGKTWAVRSTGFKLRLATITWGDSLFVAMGDSVLTSPDGLVWTAHATGRSLKNSVSSANIAWSGSRFVAALIVSDQECIITSTDGKSWSVCPFSDTLYPEVVVWAGNKFIMKDDRGIVTSADGLAWQWQSPPLYQAQGFYEMTWTGDQLIAVGGKGMIQTSPDGASWTDRDKGVREDINKVVWGHDLFVAVGTNGLIITSPDGITWTRQNSGTMGLIYSIVYTGDEFVAVGFKGLVVTSKDGINWTVIKTGFTHCLNAIAWSGSRFVAVGARADSTGFYRDADSILTGAIFTSEDGVAWKEQSEGFCGWLFAVKWTGSQFVCAGYLGTIKTSPDGITWTDHSPGATGENWIFNAIVSNGKQLVIAGTDDWNARALVAISDTISKWTYNYVNGVSALSDIAWTGDVFLATGYGGEILSSPDGGNWTLLQSGATTTLNCIAVANSQVIVAGNSGEIFSSVLDPSSLRKIPMAQNTRSRLDISIALVKSDGVWFSGTFPQTSRISFTLFNISGKRLLGTEVPVRQAGRQSLYMALPKVAKGVYILEVASAGISEKCVFNYHK